LKIACVRPSPRFERRTWSLLTAYSKRIDSKEVNDARAKFPVFRCVSPCTLERCRLRFSLFSMLFPHYVLYSALQLQLLSTADRIGFQHPFSHLIISRYVLCYVHLGLRSWNDRCSFLILIMRVWELARYDSMLKRTDMKNANIVDVRQDNTPIGGVKSCTWTSERPR
jgi:hypothetical protein